jgi:lysine 2,3-aminomutase
MENIQRIRFASKGLAVAPGRITKGEDWTETLIRLSKKGRKLGKQVCLHTHINHPREITWVTKKAANYLFEHGVIVRNQAVLLKGVNNDYDTLSELIKTLAKINIEPVRTISYACMVRLSSRFATNHAQYYVYQCDMVKGVEDLRTPLSEIIYLDKRIRGTLSGFMMPAFVVDLPGGGGKRLVSTAEEYNDKTGLARYRAIGLGGDKGSRDYYYHDPKPMVAAELAALRAQKAQALKQGQTLEQVARRSVTIPHHIEHPLPARAPLLMPALDQDGGRMVRNNLAPQMFQAEFDHANAFAATTG